MFQKRPLTIAVHAAIVFATAQSAMAAEPAGTDDQADVEEIVVTGSRIQRANEVTSSPVVQLDAEQFEFNGSPRVEDTVRSLPQVYMDQDSGQSIEVRRYGHPATAQPRRHPHAGAGRRQAIADQLQRRRLRRKRAPT